MPRTQTPARTGKLNNGKKKIIEESRGGTATEPVVTQEEIERVKKETLIEEHLPPLGLTFTVLLCSGTLLVFALRDFLSTGKNIAGGWDEALLEFTKSTQWFEGSRGWKSTQGGFSAIMSVTTDENNMGGFFVRKVCGAAAVTFYLQKLIPLLIHPTGSQWIRGHFRPLLWTAIVANLAVTVFYTFYLEDFKAAGVVELPLAFITILSIETLIILFYLITSPRPKCGPAIALPPGKIPSSCASSIVRNTCLAVTSFITLIAGRDLFFPGFIIDWIPRDDIYLEWTNAFLHSPPDGTPESIDQGLQAPLYIGDKFMGQMMALYVLINCLYKYVASVGIRYGSDGSGIVKAQMIWKVQALGCIFMTFVFRLFSHAALTASLDLRWHLMTLTYEAFVFAVYAYM